jgi:pilus assembly protein Flp/PilA
MTKLRLAWTHLLPKDTRGATAIEYALIAGGIALAIVAATALVGDGLESFFSDLAGNF